MTIIPSLWLNGRNVQHVARATICVNEMCRKHIKEESQNPLSPNNAFNIQQMSAILRLMEAFDLMYAYHRTIVYLEKCSNRFSAKLQHVFE